MRLKFSLEDELDTFLLFNAQTIQIFMLTDIHAFDILDSHTFSTFLATLPGADLLARFSQWHHLQ